MNQLKRPGQKSKIRKRTKICSVKDCGRILGSHNKSGLCHHHIQLRDNQFRRIQLKEKHNCFDCGKPIEPVLCPHCKGILKFKSRCNKCFEKIKERYKIKKNVKQIN